MHGNSHLRRIIDGAEAWWLCNSGCDCNTDGKKLPRGIYEGKVGPIHQRSEA
jgi:hypothetical protein